MRLVFGELDVWFMTFAVVCLLGYIGSVVQEPSDGWGYVMANVMLWGGFVFAACILLVRLTG